jgi:hypothetical protein
MLRDGWFITASEEGGDPLVFKLINGSAYLVEPTDVEGDSVIIGALEPGYYTDGLDHVPDDQALAPDQAQDEWNEADHPRGQPENAGQFGPGGGLSTSSPHQGKSGKFKETKKYNLAKQGLKPKRRAGGNDFTGALQVAWAHAQATGKPATILPTGRGGFTLLSPGNRIPYNSPHVQVDAEGNVTQYEPDFGREEPEPEKPAEPESDKPVFESKKDHARHLLERGTTAAELMKALGWPSISVPAMAKSLAMNLEKTKEGRTTTYKGTPMTPEQRKAANVMPPGIKRSGGPRSRDPDTWSLLEFIVDRGGIDPKDALVGDVRHLLGTKNKFVPGFGTLIRPGSIRLDRLREAAVEAKYIDDLEGTSTIAVLLGAMDEELRGNRVYKHGREPEHVTAERKADIEAENQRHADESLDEVMRDVGMDPESIAGKQRERVIEIMRKEGITDPLEAIEREAMEWVNDGSERGKVERVLDDIPGWDVPDDTGAASKPGGAAPPF